MVAETTSQPDGNEYPDARPETNQKLRSACDACHRAKVRCNGATTCSRCIRDHVECRYSYRAHLGKPKGTLNKKTIERMRAQGLSPKPVARPTARPALAGARDSSRSPAMQFGSPHTGPDSSDPSPQTPTTEADPFLDMVDIGTADNLMDLPMLDSDCIFNCPPSDYDNMMDLFMVNTQPPAASQHAGRHVDVVTPPSTYGVLEEITVQAPGSCGLASLPSRRGGKTASAGGGGGCFCVGVLAGLSQYLHETWRSQGTMMRLDQALECVQRTSAAISTVVQCSSCPFNVRVLLLIIVSLSMALEQILPAVLSASAEDKGPELIEIRVGTMDVSGHLGEAIQNLVTHSKLACLKKWLDKFDAKLSFTLDGNQAQVTFVRSEAKRLRSELEKLTDGILSR
ncbi:hypothetical protein Micbo1qcDRAFT_169726 [Microdochium bolleyi]|uniref:Zn(2)-C6 fungal-type domain-containing protein n=1 Tax=Microdochium bolleyi TaxID=196109 RepID=A0A136IJ93_9PEZI|nr:hypothetical protein Micbo1qcDRAFT_169726 [Microdochium bolleyi]